MERGIPPACFEYITISEQYLVTEICKSEVTDPRNGKVIFRKFTANILLHVCMFLTIGGMFVYIVLAKNIIGDHLSFYEIMFKISNRSEFLYRTYSTFSNLVNLCKYPKKYVFRCWFCNFSFTYLSNQILLRGRSAFKSTWRKPSFQ